MISGLTLSIIRVVVYRIPEQSKASSNCGTRYAWHHKFLKQPRGVLKSQQVFAGWTLIID